MSIRRLFFISLVAVALVTMAGIPTKSQFSTQNNEEGLVAGRNVNMVAGMELPDGDPYLQRQNEPSIAVSTRNPLHMLAGANDYRTVDWPGGPNDTETGDAWLGVFKSYNGGQKWYSELLPGYPQEGPTSHPLSGFDAAADPTVRAGPNGLFFYSGIAFDRTDHGDSVVFVARYRDNNNVENIDPAQDQDPFEYLDTTIIDTGTSGQFKDKPWIAVDKPRNEIIDILGQTVNAGNVYIVYSIFLGEMQGSPHSKIMFSKSTDYGNNWSKPIKLSEDQHKNQGTTIAIDPNDGTIYVAWRRYTHLDDPHAIVFVKSTNFGKRFTKASVVKEIEYPFDQGTTQVSFRTSAFPALAVDYDQNVYLAWSERNGGPSGYSRIMLTTSKNGGNTWSVPDPIEDLGIGHQIMPTLSFAAGKLLAAWYDLRNSKRGSEYGFGPWIDDDGNTSPWRQTIDVRASRADPPTSEERNPVFDLSIQVSRYLLGYDSNFDLVQLQYNPPNYPLFKQGTWPFIGDYIDITPAPMFIKDDSANGGWRFNYETTDPSDFHVTWTDNRDVSPPVPVEDIQDWTKYAPPDYFPPDFISPNRVYCASQYNPGMRNQNIYTSRISEGFEVGSPGNFKALNIRRAFVIFVKNKTGYPKNYILEIPLPLQTDIRAAFNEWNPGDPLEDDITKIDPLPVQPYSIFPLSVFIESLDPLASLEVLVTEIETGIVSSIVLNPDETNPGIIWEDPDNELHDPNVNIANVNIANVNIANVNIANVNIANSNIIDVNIANVNIANPNMTDVNIANVNIANVNIANVNIANTSIPDDGTKYYDYDTMDYMWEITNDGNTTSTFTFKMVAGEDLPEGLYSQLLVYRIHRTPATTKGAETGWDFCELTDETHHELLVNIANPTIPNVNIANVNIANDNIINDAIMNAPFFLAPGEEAVVALRISEPNPGIRVTGSSMFLQQTYQDFEDTLGAAVVSHAANTDTGTRQVTSTPFKIMTFSLPGGIEGVPYKRYTEEEDKDIFVRAFGGKELYTWSINTDLTPYGLNFDTATGKIYGSPTYVGDISFLVTVEDADGIIVTSLNPLTIHIAEKLTILATPPLDDALKGSFYGLTLVAQGGETPYKWGLAEGSGPLPTGLFISNDGDNGLINGTPTQQGQFTFTVEVSDSGVPEQTATRTYYLWVVKPLVITTNSLLDEIVDNEYNTNDKGVLLATGGRGAYKWTLESGVLPPGLSLILTGVISGVLLSNDPPYPHTYSFIVKVIDEGNPPQEDTQDLNITIIEPLKITSTSHLLPIGLKHDPNYSVSLNAIGGVGPYKWTRKDGSLPTGQSLSELGVISGEPTEAGLFEFEAQVEEFSTVHQIVSKYFSMFIEPRTLEITTESPLTDGNLGSDYSATLGAINGEGPLTWILKTGTLPPGLNDISEGDKIVGGEITGIPVYDPTAPYPITYTFTVQVTDNFTYPAWTGKDRIPADQSLDITIHPKKPVWSAEGLIEGTATAAAADSSGNVYVTGYTQGETTGNDYYTAKFEYNAATGLATESWKETYNGPVNGSDIPSAIAVFEDESSGEVYVFVTGTSDGGEKTTGPDICTVAYYGGGDVHWKKRYDGPSHMGDGANAIAVDLSGNVYVAGYVHRGKQTKHSDFCTIKYSRTGELLWDARYDSRRNGNDVATAITVDSSENVYVTGMSQESLSPGEPTSHDYLTIKYNSSGKRILWEKRDDGPGFGNDEPTAIAVDTSGNVYVTGQTTGGTTGADYLTIKYDAGGNKKWGENYDGGRDDRAVDIAVDNTLGNVYITGKSSGTIGNDYATIGYDKYGITLWAGDGAIRYDGKVGDDEAVAIAADDSGNIFVTGFTTSTTGIDFYTIRYDSDGNIVWIARYDGPSQGDDITTAMVVNPSGVFVAGFSKKDSPPQVYAVVKYEK